MKLPLHFHYIQILIQNPSVNILMSETLYTSAETLYTSEMKIMKIILSSLTLSRRRPLSYRNQSIDLLRKSVDWFLYDNGLRLERVNNFLNIESYQLHVMFCAIWYYLHNFKNVKNTHGGELL